MPAGATYEPIATTTLGTAASEIAFSSIPSTYTDLRVVWTARVASTDFPILRINSDTGTNYSNTILYGNGTSAASTRASSTATLYLGADIGIPTATNTFCLITIDFFNYAGSTNKTFLSVYSNDRNGSGEVNRAVGLWRSTSAINALSLRTTGVNLAVGSTATLYGIKAA
jgi:hypothetical protein